MSLRAPAKAACLAAAFLVAAGPILLAKAEPPGPSTTLAGPSAALVGEAEAFGPRPAPYFQQLPIRLTVAHTLASAGNAPLGGNSMSAVLDAGYIEGLLKPDGPSLSVQKIETDLTSPSKPRDAGPESVAAQDAGAVTIDAGTVEAHSRPQPQSVAEARAGGVVLEGGAVVAQAVHTLSEVSIEGGAGARLRAESSSELTGVEIAGVVTVGSIRQTASVEMTGRAGESAAEARTVVAGLAVAGIPATLDSEGLHAAGQDLSSAPAADQAIRDALAGAGISLRLLESGTSVDPGARFAEAGAGALLVTFLATVGAPVPGTPRQDAGLEFALGGAAARAAAAPLAVPPPLRTPGTIEHEAVWAPGPPSVPPVAETGPIALPPAPRGATYRTMRVVVRHFLPARTAGFFGAILAGMIGPLLVFRRNPLAAAVLASPARGCESFLRYLVRG
ncbi:MAG: hypothetical protein HY775_05810 [Acidobacteria bacterium]|nr:hypothetical protein [Acidobacteriota bacterium]